MELKRFLGLGESAKKFFKISYSQLLINVSFLCKKTFKSEKNKNIFSSLLFDTCYIVTNYMHLLLLIYLPSYINFNSKYCVIIRNLCLFFYTKNIKLSLIFNFWRLRVGSRTKKSPESLSLSFIFNVLVLHIL